MSLQNLLEMDSFSQQSSLNERDEEQPKPKPRPRPRKLVSKMDNSPTRKKERDIDDAISLSPENGSRSNLLQSTSPDEGLKKRKTTISAFDNKAFLSDEDNMSDVSSVVADRAFISSKRPPMSPKKSNIPRLASPSLKRSTLRRDSSVEEDLKSARDALAAKLEEDKSNSSDGRSDDTYTIEDETNQNQGKTTPKQFKTIKHPSRIPKLQERSSRVESPTPTPPPERDIKPEPRERQTRKKDGNISESQSLSGKSATATSSKSKTKKKEDHLAVDIELEDETKVEDVKESESDIVSVSSAPKGSVKARFGKLLFGSQSKFPESKRKTVNPPLDNDNGKEEKKEKDKDKDKDTDKDKESVSSSGAKKEKSGFVFRWRSSLLKAKGKDNFDESTEELETLNRGESSDLQNENDSPKNVRKKPADTRIRIPDEDLSDEDASIGSYSSVMEDMPEISKKRGLRKEARDVKSNEIQDEERGDMEEEEENVSKKSSFRKLKPFANIWRGKSKSSDREQAPSKEMEKPSNEKVDKSSIDVKSKSDIQKTMPETPKETRKKEKSKMKISKMEIESLKSEVKAERKAQDKSQKKSSRKVIEVSATEADSESKSESDSEPEVKTKRSKSKTKTSPDSKPKRKQKVKQHSEPLRLTDTVSGKDLLFGVTIHQSDLLPLDPNVIHPVVKVTVMYQNGQYMKKGEQQEGNSTVKSKGGKERRKSRRTKSEEFFTENMSDSVLPIMSQPCQARYSIPTFAPTWNELLVFEEPFKRFALPSDESDSEKEPIIFFEIMDFLPMTENGNSVSVSGFHGTDAGWYKVAWAFLKPLGANGVINLNKKLRLQLFKPVKLRSKLKSAGPEVFSWWKSEKREKISCTLYVTPKGIIPPETKTASLRQLLSMRKEQLTQAILDSQLATKRKQRSLRQSIMDLREQANWSRMEGQSCKPPNKLVATLPTSQIESLNIVISGNVHCIKFSPCGRKLAAGLDTDELHVILIFEVPSWTLLKTLKGHHGIIYEITWKIFELDDEATVHYLASASADSTVRIWKMENHDEKTMKLMKVLYHPSYVYSVKFHPTNPSIVATGCFDSIVRVWDFKPEHSEQVQKKKGKHSRKDDNMAKSEVSPIVLLDKHNNFINCLVFDHGGQHLFCGDGSACIYKWSCTSPSVRKYWKLERDAKLHNGDVPVNSIDLHPSGNRILVQLRDNFIKVLDVVTFIPLQSFSGLSNERFQIRSCFSPCGNLVLSGSEDSTLCIWDADTGKIIQFVCPRNHPHCIVSSVDYHPFDYYIAIGVASAISEPSPVLVYFHEQPVTMTYPMLKKSAMRFKQSVEKSRSQSTESMNNNETGEVTSRPLPAKRGDSTEKFISIIQKLDAALYLAQQRNKHRVDETKMSTCVEEEVSRKNSDGEV